MTGDGTTTALALSVTPQSENQTQVYIDGVYQSKDNYSVSGSTLTFSTAPPSGTSVEVMVVQNTTVGTPSDGTVTSAKLSGDLVTPGALTVTTGLAVDTDTLFVDATNNRVGIGNSVMSSMFSTAQNLVVGTGSGNNGVTVYSQSNAVGDIAFADGTTDPAYYSGLIRYDHSLDAMRLFTSSAEAARIDSSGNVGIGTSSPNSYSGFTTLTLDGTSGSLLDLEVNGTVTGEIYADTSFGIGMQAIGSRDIQFKTNNTERMRIDTSGHLIVPNGVTLGTAAGTYAAANTLDDYEEGTWTPNIQRVNGTVPATFSVGSGSSRYTKIGNVVHLITFIYNISNGSSNGSSYWVIYGVPFAAQVIDYSASALAYNSTGANSAYVGDAGGNIILTANSTPYSGSLSGNLMLNITYKVT
jgi:hypothetical protein